MDSNDPAQSTINPALLAKLPPELNNAIKTFTFLAQMQDVYSTTDLEMIAKRVCNYQRFDVKTIACWINALVSGLDSFPIQHHSSLYLSLILVYAYQIHLCKYSTDSTIATRNSLAGLPSTVQPWPVTSRSLSVSSLMATISMQLRVAERLPSIMSQGFWVRWGSMICECSRPFVMKAPMLTLYQRERRRICSSSVISS